MNREKPSQYLFASCFDKSHILNNGIKSFVIPVKIKQTEQVSLLKKATLVSILENILIEKCKTKQTFGVFNLPEYVSIIFWIYSSLNLINSHIINLAKIKWWIISSPVN
uniref:Uncharacterized protein n=1 Tax=Sphaerodactylus townsendi TaxID=933632 RepID=A0ACB8EJ81_9SAUR